MNPRVLTSLLALFLCVILPELAYASNSFEQGFCRMAGIFETTCNILAIVGLLIFGILMLLGKGTWGLALLHLVASIVFASAGAIADALGASSSCP